MKKILVLGMMLIASTTFAQSSDNAIAKAIDKGSTVVESSGNAITKATEKVYSDGTAIVKEAYSITKDIAPKVEEALKSLGTSLKVGAGNVWDILVKQQRVWSICTLIGLIASIFAWVHFWKRMDILNKQDTEGAFAAALITFGLALTGSIVVGVHFTEMITGFVNPEFGAMNSVVEYAKMLK